MFSCGGRGGGRRFGVCIDFYGTVSTTELCANTGARGLIMLGDSATAHFRIPNEWFNATEISWSVRDLSTGRHVVVLAKQRIRGVLVYSGHD